MTDPIKPIPDGIAVPMPGARSTKRSTNREKVVMNVVLPQCTAPITLVEASSCITMICNAGNLQMTGIAIYQPDKTTGLMHLLTCEEARMLADSLVELAGVLEKTAGSEAAAKLAQIRAGNGTGQAGVA